MTAASPTRSPQEREELLLDVLTQNGVWMSIPSIGTVTRNRGLRMAPGSLRGVLDRLADQGRCERRRGPGTSSSFHVADERGTA